MDLKQHEWNNFYKSFDRDLTYDLWLEKHSKILESSKGIPILDLGCGFGNDSFYLCKKGFNVIAADYSEAALKRIKKISTEIETKFIDMREVFPFANNSFQIIVADLSLHYFSWTKSKMIIKEISRILNSDGFLVCRFNSIKDFNYGAGKGCEIEKNYYRLNNNLKRFFDKEDIRTLFSEWEMLYCMEETMLRYDKPKEIIEVILKNLRKEEL